MNRMLERLEAREERRRPDDDALHSRALELSERYLAGLARPESVRWVDNQQTRWGSCTPEDGAIRLSRRLSGMPPWVVDYVLLHELVHLIIPHHGPEFWDMVRGYPKADRARGYLEGVSDARRFDAVADLDPAVEDEADVLTDDDEAG